MKVLKAIIMGVGIFALGLFVIGFIIGLTQSTDSAPQLTQQSKDNTFRNSFISGCTEDGTMTYSACSCGYDRLLAIHPDFNTNKALMNRILAEGYNQAETNAIVSCVN